MCKVSQIFLCVAALVSTSAIASSPINTNSPSRYYPRSHPLVNTQPNVFERVLSKVGFQHWYVGLGGAWNRDYLQGTKFKPFSQYTTQYNSASITKAGAIDMFFGAQFSLLPKNAHVLPFYRLGFKYEYQTPHIMRGVVDLMPGSVTDIYRYNYKLTTHLFMFDATLPIVNLFHIMPYVQVGAGLALNHLFDYTQRRGGQIQSYNYSANYHEQLAYSFGAGVNIRVLHDLEVGANYQYINQGQAQFGKPISVPGDGRPRQQSFDVTSRTVGLSLTFLIR